MNVAMNCTRHLCLCGLLGLLATGQPTVAGTLVDWKFEHGSPGTLISDVGSNGISLKAVNGTGPTVASDAPPESSGIKTSAAFKRAQKNYLSTDTVVEAFNFKQNQPFTIEGWFYLSSLPVGADQPHIFCNRSPLAQQNIGIAVLVTANATTKDNADLRFFVDGGNMKDQGFAKAESVLEAGKWYHFAAIRDADGTLRIDLDGNEVANSKTIKVPTALPSSAPTLLGKSGLAADKVVCFDGLIAELKISDEALPMK